VKKKYPPFPPVFFEDNEMLAPRELRKYGYRLKKGMTYRLYSLSEIKDRIKEGSIVPLKELPEKAKTPVEETVVPPTPPPYHPPTEEEIKAREAKKDRINALETIIDALVGWHIREIPSKRKGWRGVLKAELIPVSIANWKLVREALRKFSVTLVWDEERNGMKLTLQSKENKNDRLTQYYGTSQLAMAEMIEAVKKKFKVEST